MALKTSSKGKGSGQPRQVVEREPDSYASRGVKDNDIFLLPTRDYQIMAALTMLAMVVRLYKIYQPTSVVFDEVQ